MRTKMADQIKELEEALKEESTHNKYLAKQVETLEKRLKDVAGENESLRMDKKWLQAMHSNLLQSLVYKGER